MTKERKLRAPLRPKQGSATGDGKSSSAAASRLGRPLGSRNKPETPGKVCAVGVDVPRISALVEALEDIGDGEEARPEGRPTAYRPEFARIAEAMCKMGAGDPELAEEFGVTVQTIWRWRCKYPEFCYALTQGKEAWDDRIERSLAMRAAGYSVHTEKLFNYEGKVVRAQTIEHFPPDVGAIKLWLGNRRPDTWRDKQEVKLDGSEAFLKVWEAISEGRA